MEQALYPSGLKTTADDLQFTESSKTAAILRRTTDILTPGIISGWTVKANITNPQLIDVGNNPGTPNVAFDANGERITAIFPSSPTSLLSQIALNDNNGGTNYIFLSYSPQQGSARAHSVTGALLNARQTDSFRIEVKTSIGTVNLDTFGKPQILLASVVNNYGTLSITPSTAVSQIQANLLLTAGVVIWLDNPSFRVVQATNFTLQWNSNPRFSFGGVIYTLQGTSSNQFVGGSNLLAIAILNTGAGTATLTFIPTGTALTTGQALLGFVSTDNSITFLDGLLPISISADNVTSPTSANSTILSRLNQLQWRIRESIDGNSWLSPLTAITGVFRGAVNLAQLTSNAAANILGLQAKFKGTSPVSLDNANYGVGTNNLPVATGHAHLGVDGDGPQLTLDALELGIQRTLSPNPVPVAIVSTSPTVTSLLDDRNFRNLFIGTYGFRIQLGVTWANPGAGQNITLVSTAQAGPLLTGNNGGIVRQDTLMVLPPAGGTILAPVGVTLLIDPVDGGRLKLQVSINAPPGLTNQYISSLAVNKVTIFLFPVMTVASPTSPQLGLGGLGSAGGGGGGGGGGGSGGTILAPVGPGAPPSGLPAISVSNLIGTQLQSVRGSLGTLPG